LSVPADHATSITPYDIFCIPYGEINLYAGTSTYVSNEEMGYKLASRVIKELDQEHLYDIQLLPYCPLPKDKLVERNGKIGVVIDNGTSGHELLKPSETASEGTTTPSALFWVKNPSFSFQIEADATDASLVVPSNSIDAKIECQTSFHRLSSPNYNGTFEFSAIKNDGV
jgi:hypothetical protein